MVQTDMLLWIKSTKNAKEDDDGEFDDDDECHLLPFLPSRLQTSC